MVTPDQGGGVRRVTVAWLVPRGRAARGACLPICCFWRLAWVVISRNISVYGVSTDSQPKKRGFGWSRGEQHIYKRMYVYTLYVYIERGLAPLSIYASGVARAHTRCIAVACVRSVRPLLLLACAIVCWFLAVGKRNLKQRTSQATSKQYKQGNLCVCPSPFRLKTYRFEPLPVSPEILAPARPPRKGMPIGRGLGQVWP